MVSLPSFFSDGMVVRPTARIWGKTAPGQRVDIHFQGEIYEATAAADGAFAVTVQGVPGGPYEMRVGDRLIREVYVGRVWLCGGQSNMETPLSRAALLLDGHIHADERIRVFQGEKGLRFDASAEDVSGVWQTAAGDLSLFAVPYFFARALLENDPSPIGLINIAAGGTPIEGWLPEENIQSFPDLAAKLESVKAPGFIEARTREANNRAAVWHKTLADTDAGLSGNWHRTDYDDSGWDTRMLLDHSGLEHGAVWLRKKFMLPGEVLTGAFALRFGRVADSVRVYINGTEVVSVAYQYPPCACNIPDGVLQAGENTIAVRIVGEGQRPHCVPGKEYALIGGGVRVELGGEWRWRVGCKMPPALPGAWFYGEPCGVYNFMLAPVLGYSVDGVIWYQGESNTGRPQVYEALFSRFVAHLRARCGADLPVIFAQLANYVSAPLLPPGEGWALLREAQRRCLSLPNTAMAVAIDCGEWNDLHPLDKKTVGERLALCARRLVYKEAIVSDGPRAIRAVRRQGKLTVSFEHAQGLWAKGGHLQLDLVYDGGYVAKAYAIIEGETLTAQVNALTAPANCSAIPVNAPLSSVRFNWEDCPAVVLYNAYNLPASPFMLPVETETT